MAMKISISFKDNEMYLFTQIKSQLSSSVYIKQLVLDDISRKKDKEVGKSKIEKTSAPGIDWD